MASKLVNDRTKESEQVVAAAQTHALLISEFTQRVLATVLEANEKSPDVLTLITLAGRLLERSARRMIEADAAHTAELGDDDEHRATRDTAAAEVYQRLVELRSFLVGVFGIEAMSKLGFTQQVPSDPAMLSKFAEEVLSALSKKLPTPKKKSLAYDPSTDEDLKETTQQKAILDQALSDVKREAREAEATLIAKNQAIEDFDTTFSKVVALLYGLFRFADQEELAERIRPLVRASRRAPTSETTTDTKATGNAIS